ncbi:zinc finger CCCH domain-containing protein 24 isoform X3 [Vitis riparia]|uniref:zinc finger CCCH domain-containing protein 24 isoform X3 n=1 Tax=Vitis riparia TaxID=96939 RepID=UPI00155ADB93|nr:zinc finger CCCH domain-containing protein 24 isoform X3 [Vitis riparia]
MASSPDDQTSAKQTLNPSINGNDAPCPPQEHVGDEELKPSVPQSTDVIESGEKRKRSDPADSDNCRHPLWKTSLCSYFRSHSGSCSHGDACRYAHGEEELRQRPDNTWDPTSERAKKLLKSESGEKCDSKEDDVMMTEAVVDDGCADPGLSKCLLHLPPKWHSDQLRDFLGQQGVIYKSAKKKKGMMIGFVTFESAEQLKNAMEELEGKSIGNKNLKVGDILPRSFEKKNNSALPLHQSTQKKMETALGGDDTDVSMSSFGLEDGDAVCDSSAPDSVLKARSARDVATPLAHLTYTDQLEHKKNSLMQTLKKLTRNARKACPNGVSLPEWILKSREIGGLPCKFEGILESPLVNGYRNKCEFSVGYSLQGKPTVGFMLGNFREGITAVEEPADCPNVSMIARRYATIFQEFLQHSGLPLWNRFNNTGFWRQLTDHKGISNVASADAPLRPLPIPKEGSDSGPDAGGQIVEARIHDYISNLRFCISPTAFFQVNTLAAEKLYSLAGDWAGLGPDTLLFDVCCGTGTIGLTLAHRVGMVVGIEMNASAVSDAQRNAELNGIENCRFVCAKAEDVMGSLLKEYLSVPQRQNEVPDFSQSDDKVISNSEDKMESINNALNPEGSSSHELESGKGASGCLENVQRESKNELHNGCSSKDGNISVQQFKNFVAIVDPPRGGLHPIVIKALRTHACLRRLVSVPTFYISCNPESLVANAIELCTPSTDKTEKGNKNNRGWRNMSSAGLARHRAKSMPNSEPFQPVKAMAVDLFPHTPHCEMVMLLER